jgi:hypothetical protein
MIPFKINGAKHNFPTTWNDVTYSQYIALLQLPNSLLHYINLFTGIPLETLQSAELKNLERISIALSFLAIPPKYQDKPTGMVGPYAMPSDVTIQSLGQFEDLRALTMKLPTDLKTTENRLLMSELALEACAIYVQKIKHSKYDSVRVPEVKEELKNYSCIEVTQTGTFFLAKPLNILQTTTPRYRNIKQRVKKLIQDLPGFQKTLDSLQRSLGSHGK